MHAVFSGTPKFDRVKTGFSALVLLTCAFVALPIVAQQKGPLPPPPPGTVIPPSAPPKTSTTPHETSSRITNEPPDIPVDQLIQKFTEREAEFRKERENYTYTQTVIIQTIDENGQPDGEYRLKSDILFTPAGKRYEKVIDAPTPTIQRIYLTQQDYDDIEKVWPLVLTPDELPKYDVKYVGREQIDEIGTYVFDVTPKKLEKGERYFQGRVWVEGKDLQIVKTAGISTGLKKKKEDSAYPRFETFRENIESHYWFPTYTRCDDVLHFHIGDEVHIRVAVRYENYKRFGATIKIGKPTQVDPEKP